MQSQVVEQKADPNEPKVIAIRVPHRKHKKLKGLALKRDMTVNEVYLEAVDAYLEAQ